MDLFLDSIIAFAPQWGDPKDWNRAYEKLDAYLKAHEVHDHLHRTWAITETLRRVERRWAGKSSGQSLPTLAMEEINEWMIHWFAGFLPENSHASDPIAGMAEGRVALFLCDVFERWPRTILAPSLIPESLKTSLEQRLMQAGPELEFSSMVPRNIDFGRIPIIADNTMDVLNRWPIIRALVVWIVYLALLSYLFWITR